MASDSTPGWEGQDDGDVETNVIDSAAGAPSAVDCLQLQHTETTRNPLSSPTPSPDTKYCSDLTKSSPDLTPVQEEQEPAETEPDPSASLPSPPPTTTSTSPFPFPPLSSPSPPPRSLTMPKLPTLTNLPDLALHSPNSQIVGTPFTTNNNNKFEYPFPDSSSSSPDATPSTSMSNSIFSTFVAPSNQLSSSPPSLSNFPTTFPPQSEISNYTPAHPKMRQPNAPPPVPPGLVKKKHRWSLGLIGRRRSSYGSQTSEGSANGTSSSIDALVEQGSRSPTQSHPNASGKSNSS